MTSTVLRSVVPLGFALLCCTPASVVSQQRVEHDVVYGLYFGTTLLMDVYHPATPNGIGVVWINGSGFHAAPPGRIDSQLKNRFRGDRDAQVYLDAGLTLFVINHRAAPRFRYPDAIVDATRAVRFIRFHAERFGIDPDMIAARGSSSGGHIASLLGTLDEERDLSDPDPVARESARVQAVIAVSPSTDLTKIGSSEPWSAHIAQTVASFIGTSLRHAPRVYAEASPVTHVTPDDAPFLIVHGTADSTIPYAQAEGLEQALRGNGVQVDLVSLPGVGHGIGPRQFEEGRAVAWLTETFFGQDSAASLASPLAAHHRMVAEWSAAGPDSIDLAFRALERAHYADLRLHVPAWYWNRLCWRGGVRDRAADVIAACDRAVSLDPENIEYRDSRGLVRAMLGDIPGAVDDFEFFLSHIIDRERFRERRAWVEQFRSGHNPFTSELLERLRG